MVRGGEPIPFADAFAAMVSCAVCHTVAVLSSFLVYQPEIHLLLWVAGVVEYDLLNFCGH